MTIDGVHYNEKAVIGMSKKQFIAQLKTGTNMTDSQLEKVHETINKKNADDSKPSKSGTVAGSK